MIENGSLATMIQKTFKSAESADEKSINYLKSISNFEYKLQDGICTEISFHDINSIFGGTIRRNPYKKEIIEIVSKMKGLKHFDIRKCKICNLPEMSSQNLEFVDISCNDIEYFPNWIAKQQFLKYLNIGANKIKEIPDLSHLELEVFKLHKNTIDHLPPIGKKIKSLNLFLNRIQEIPKQVFDLNMLEVFTFGVTEMKDLPNLSSLENIRWLTLTVNKIQNIPDDICMLKNLEGLQLAKNCIKELPQKIGEMNLKVLTLYSNNISKLPDSFFNLKLKKLNLALNQIEEKEKNKIKEFYGNIDFISI